MTTAELPVFFDGLATQEEADKLSRYQKAGQREVLATFEKLVNETILEVNENKKAGRRIVGALLLGSFANHAAGPESDLDVQLLSEDGSPFGIEEVMRRLKGKWKEAGYARHPIGGFQYALPLSKNLLMRIHQEPYMIFSPYARVLKKMGLTPEGETSSPSSVTTIRGALFVALYTQLLKAILTGYEAAAFLRRHLPF
jgi:predicted nucleotidyltransferase